MIVGISITLTGCLKNDWEECEKKSDAELSKYISQNNISDQYKMESGLYYVPDTVGTGLSPESGDYIFIEYTGWYSDGNIIETTDSTLKSGWAASDAYTNYIYGATKIRYGYSRPGFNEGLSLMKEGGWARLIIPTELAYYNCLPVIYKIHLISVIENAVEYEKSMMVQYLAQNGMDTVSSLYNDIYYKELTASSDTHSVELTDTVLIRFTGSFIYKIPGDAEVRMKEFDSNLHDAKPLKMVYGNNSVIFGGSVLAIPKGFITALDTMQTGTRARVILPYTQGFGESGLSDGTYGYSIVPDYQTVVYDLYVEGIIPAP